MTFESLPEMVANCSGLLNWMEKPPLYLVRWKTNVTERDDEIANIDFLFYVLVSTCTFFLSDMANYFSLCTFMTNAS